MYNKKLAWNTMAALTFQATTIICGFILPRLILQYFGSEINGLVNSISQFLTIIAFLELGVGTVVQSALYRPLTERNMILISKIIASAQKFFKRLAQILVVYVVVLMVVYPRLVNQNYEYLYTAALIGAMSISSFTQFYFGVVDRLLLTADQRGYIQYNAQTITLIANTLVCSIMIRLGASILIVKLSTSLIYLVRPVLLRKYVNHYYDIDRKIQYTGEPIKQKWNGIAQHVAAVILDSTDIVILTIFGTLKDVSVFSVYYLVVNGVKQLFNSLTSGVQALLGELWAKGKQKDLNNFFSMMEWGVHTCAVFVWSCVFVLIVPFVQVYTKGVTDTDYVVPLFAFIIVLANAMHGLRIPYNIMILAANHYKQTQSNYIVAAFVNLVVSLIAVQRLGLVGVAIGTLLAMTYQTIWMAFYDSKNLLERPISIFLKQLLTDIITVVIIVLSTNWINLASISYLSWIIMSIKVAIFSAIIIIVINLIVFPKKILKFSKIILRKLN
jgi:hypothetical protein